MNVLVEAVSSMVFGTRLHYFKELGWSLVGIDISNQAFGFYTNELKAYIVSKYSNTNCFDEIEEIIKKHNINLIFPTVNEGLLEWAKRKTYFKQKFGAEVLIPNEEIIHICVDKWNTYLFFKKNNIPTPKTSVELEFELIKPRIGSGSKGIKNKHDIDTYNFSMEGYITQEIVTGDEYTIDVLCDFKSNPIYIIPRKRLKISGGLSIQGMTVYDKQIIEYVRKIIRLLKPTGIINIQCIKNMEGIYFIEINPRMAGGVTLSFASSDNWFKAIDQYLKGEDYYPKDIIYGNHMFRYYEEIIVPKSEILTI